MGTPSIGALAKLAFDASSIGSGSEAYEFISCSLGMQQEHVYNNGIRGTRSRHQERVRIARERVSGTIEMNPSVTELDRLWPRILGSGSSGTGTIAETIPEFVAAVDRVASVHTYSGCKVSRATLRGSQGAPMMLSLDIEGKTESVASNGTFPAITIDTNGAFHFTDLTLTLGGTAREIQSFDLVIDNVLDTERFMNALTRTHITPTDRIVTMSAITGWTSDEVDLYDMLLAGVGGSLVMSDGNTTYTFTFGNLKIPANTPPIQGKGEILQTLNITAYKTGSTPEIAIAKS